MSDTATIRAGLIARYPQMLSIAQNAYDAVFQSDPDTTLTAYSIIDLFIEDAKLQMNDIKWQGKYDRGVILLACHFLTYSQSEAVNSGVLVQQTTGSGPGQSVTEFMRPALSNFGEYATTKYGQQWEALRNEVLKGSFSRGIV